MNRIDLRMMYKADTGNKPTHQSNYKGILKRDYAIWLENKLPWYSRLLYKKDTGHEALWYKYSDNMRMYTQKYKEWMEEKILEKSINAVKHKQII